MQVTAKLVIYESFSRLYEQLLYLHLPNIIYFRDAIQGVP